MLDWLLSHGEDTITHSLMIKDIVAPKMIMIVIFCHHFWTKHKFVLP